MIDAKLQGIEGRLLPEKRLRPPLASDRTPAPPDRTPAPATAATEAKRPGAAASGAKAKREKEKTARPLPPPPPSMEERWTEVVKKKDKAGPAVVPPQTGQKGKKAKKKKRKSTQSAKNPAVVITLPRDSESHSHTYNKLI
ncbi:unnamed protein product [Danaus chrysippus]|uniref:(African queen) hypothetical protein n=1 Tax=Danaus chrysippus TaxID=151541 RepID=A0A8J2QQF1_9NEOP|nr:unnamed protein product [Danaus chrysippus]